MSERQGDTAQFKMDLDRHITRSDLQEAMNTQYQLSAGRQRRDAGMAQAASHRKETLIAAKAIARSIAHIHGSVTIDDVVLELEHLNLTEGLGPASGAVFKDRAVWQCVGWEPSKRASNHARFIRRWRLRNGA